ncbi:hypothetical protein FIE12Z_2259 [Fusarium flagelliforme]|uniref:Uncharacterized protein n=1 Tax=Fusarium flagelliforme TaxID=2675880 RepID=A0A395MZV1_9HYPO|nr:hypothetical protein FIE12Z_2259 [Fusarium flagelliforme]
MHQLLHESLLCQLDDPQEHSPLFHVLPGEIRDSIFSYVLTDHPDPSNQFSDKTCYTRPSWKADQSTDTRLLRTCRAIYRETWFKPFLLREHTRWLSSPDRAPPSRHRPPPMSRMLKRIADQQGTSNVEIERLRIFAQMYKLEDGELKRLLNSSYLAPRIVTLTIRHTDWWFWEDDEPLRFEANWIKGVASVLSSSTNRFCFELESLKRKKDQVDKIAAQMIKKWYFKRKDGVVLYADATTQESQWNGSSTWNNQRWVRDETEDGRLDYCIVTVTFRPKIEIERKGGSVSETAFSAAQAGSFDEEEMKLHLPGQSRMEVARPYQVIPRVWDGRRNMPRNRRINPASRFSDLNDVPIIPVGSAGLGTQQ